MIDIFVGGVLPIFAIGAIGYLFGRLGTFDVAMATAINRLVFFVGIPMLGFRLIVRAPLEDFDLTMLLGFLISELVVYLSAAAVGRYVFKCDAKESILLGLACALTNHILFVLPMAIVLFGELAATPIIAIVTMDTIILFSGTLIIMEFMTSETGALGHVMGKIVRNPPVMSVVAGFAVALSGLVLPKGVDVFLDFTSGIAAPCALFSLGIILSQPQQPGRAMLPVALTGVKLILHPVLAWLLLVTLFEVAPAIANPAMMVAAAPCGAMGFVLALNYGVRVDAIARAVFYTTIGSLATITIAASL